MNIKDCNNRERLAEVDSKVDKILESVSAIEVTIAKQQIILDEHIKRTKQVEDELVPIKAYYNQVLGAIKLVGFLGFSGLLGIISYFIKR